MKTFNTKLAIALLEEARVNIESGKNIFICWALEAISSGDTEKERTVVKIKEWMFIQLGGKVFTYGDWLNSNYPEKSSEYLEDMRSGRIVWIDAMIEELRK